MLNWLKKLFKNQDDTDDRKKFEDRSHAQETLEDTDSELYASPTGITHEGQSRPVNPRKTPVDKNKPDRSEKI